MDDFEQFRDELVWGFLLIAAGAHSTNPADQFDTARDFKDAIKDGYFTFDPDEGLKTQLGKALKQNPAKWKDDSR